MREQAALNVLRSYPADAQVSDLYDRDAEFSQALGEAFAGKFEYPDWSWRMIGDVVKSIEKAFFADPGTATPARVLNDRYADTIIGNNVANYDALEIHGVRDLNPPNHPDGTQCEIDEETPQFFSVYAHVCDRNGGGVECVGDFTEHTAAGRYAAELSQKYNYPVFDFSEQGKHLAHEIANSGLLAEKAAAEKVASAYVDPNVTQVYAGKVMYADEHHLVISLGRNAAIFKMAMFNGSDVIKSGSEITVAVGDGKARVLPEKDRGVGIDR